MSKANALDLFHMLHVARVRIWTDGPGAVNVYPLRRLSTGAELLLEEYLELVVATVAAAEERRDRAIEAAEARGVEVKRSPYPWVREIRFNDYCLACSRLGL